MIITAVLTLNLLWLTVKNHKRNKKRIDAVVKILPTLLSVIILVSIVLHFVSNELILEYLGENAGWQAYISAAILGSVSMLPGFIA